MIEDALRPADLRGASMSSALSPAFEFSPAVRFFGFDSVREDRYIYAYIT